MAESKSFEKVAEMTGSHPIRPGAPTKLGRLGVEARVIGFHAAMWVFASLLSIAWSIALLTPDQFSRIPWFVVATPLALGFVANMTALTFSMPRTRWLRGGSLVRSPSPWPLMLLGIVAAPWFLVLWIRNRSTEPDMRVGSPSIERAFESLLGLPRAAATAMAATLGPALAISGVLLVLQVPLPKEDTLSWVLLTMSTSLPFVAVSYSRTHALLRPELLSAPRDPTQALRWRRDLRVRLAFPASIACFGAVLAPLLTAHMWQRAQLRAGALAEAATIAESLPAGSGAAGDESLGRFLAKNPGVSVVSQKRSYGPEPPFLPKQSGPIDMDVDGRPEAFAVVRGEETVVVPVEPPMVRAPRLLGVAALCLLGVGLVCIWIIALGVREDVLRAGRQVRRVAKGLVPDPLRVDSFHTLELRELVRAVDRLVARIAEANVAKYVVIEKAQEADRLRSQFLANMSHDLRSPLNSVLGFSELLLTGIDGEITKSQAEMVEVIQASGRFLLQQIDDILDTAKIDAGRMEIHAEPTPPATLLSRAVKRARVRLGSGIEISTQSNAGLPPTFSDPYRAVQAIENVLVFAAERVPEGGHLIVRTSAEKHRNGRSIIVEVATPNPPATMEQLDRVLEGFVRIPGHRGLGLGLPLAGSVLELHGGSLDIEEGEGYMRFLMRFPVPERRRRLRLDESS